MFTEHIRLEPTGTSPRGSTTTTLMTWFVSAVALHVVALIVHSRIPGRLPAFMLSLPINDALFFGTVLLAWLTGSAMIFSRIMERRQRRLGMFAALTVGAIVMTVVALALSEWCGGYGVIYWTIGSWLAFPVMFVIGTLIGDGDRSS